MSNKIIAKKLDEAAMNATAIAQFNTDEDAYAIQRENIAHRLARGEKLVGVKMGFTSKAKMIQMGVDDVIIGRLTDAMQFAAGQELLLENFIHPRIEPEIAFLLKAPLNGEVTLAEAAAAVDKVAPAMEIIDSRFQDFKFSLSDVIADNASSAGFIIGRWQDMTMLIDNLGMVVSYDGVPILSGSSAAIYGDPLLSLAAAARKASQIGLRLEAGMIILAGSATAAEALRAGVHVSLQVQHLGNVAINIADKGK